MSSALSRVATVVTTTATRRTMSTTASSGPKLHRAKKTWWILQETRPHTHEHLTFEGDFNKGTIYLIVGIIVFGGWGVIEVGMRHQQYKQGYWK